jgi:hypothetical protein
VGNLFVSAYNGASRAIDRNLFVDVPTHPFVKETLSHVHRWKWQFAADQKAIILRDNYIPVGFYNAWMSERIRKAIVENTDWDVLSS